MKKRIVNALIVVLLVYATGLNALAWNGTSSTGSQQSSASDAELDQLRASIRNLEAKDRDPSLSPEIKTINRQLLTELRGRLLRQLTSRLDALRRYQAEIKSSVDDRVVNQMIESRVAALEKEINDLRQALAAGPSGLAEATTTPTTPTNPPETTEPDTRETNTPTEEADTPAASTETRPRTTSSANTSTTTLAGTDQTEGAAPVVTDEDDLQDCTTYTNNPKSFSLFAQYVCNLSQDLKDRKRGRAPNPARPNAGFNFGDDFFRIALLIIAKKDRPAFIVEAEEARTDKQVGSTPSSSGSTSLTVKGTAPKVLGLAVENGALTQSISGTTVTFRGNPLGIVQALADKGFIQSYEESQSDTFARLFKGLSFSLSFDTSRGNDPNSNMPNVFTADRQQLSQFGFRYEFYNNRDPRARAHKEKWEKFVFEQGTKLSQSFEVLAENLRERDPDDTTNRKPKRLKDPGLRDWYVETDLALRAARADQVEGILRDRLRVLPINNLSPDTVAVLDQFRLAFQGYIEKRNEILADINKGGIVTFDYTNTRQVNAPNLSNFMLIAEKGAGGRFDATFNGSLTIFDKIPVGMTKRVRDFQFSGQFDAGLGNVRGIGNLVFSLSGKYERLMEDAMAPDGMTMMNTKGDIAIGQLKLTIPIKGLGVKMPVSVTFANRTELIKEKEVRGNIGFTFDLDTLFAKFKP
jgi:hypothetical protein